MLFGLMKKYFIFILLVLLSCRFQAQFRMDFGVKTGASNYLGDIGGNENSRRDFVNDLKLAETRMSLGAFVRYRVFRNISLAFSYNYGRIAGDDKLSSNPGRRYRNLSFRNDIHELALEGQYFFYTYNDLGHTYLFENNFRAYAGLGAALFYHDPKAYYQGTWVDLRPLKTEGELKPYSEVVMAIPLSLGCYFTFKKSYRIGWELGWRKTFTDYLDDISNRYASPATLGNPLAIVLANRTGELKTPPGMADNYSPGSKRGDPTHDDSYIFTTINFSYVLKGKGAWYRKTLWQKHDFIRRKRKVLRVRF